jgi:hypothetical protein
MINHGILLLRAWRGLSSSDLSACNVCCKTKGACSPNLLEDPAAKDEVSSCTVNFMINHQLTLSFRVIADTVTLVSYD